MEKLKKKITLKTQNKNIKSVYGTYNRINPTSIYLQINAWVKYNGDIKQYQNQIEKLNRSIKNSIRENILNTNKFSSNFMYIQNIKKVLTTTEKPFYTSFEIYLTQTNTENIKEIYPEMENINNQVIETIKNNLNFSIT